MIRGHLFALRMGLMASDAAAAAILFGVISVIRFNDARWTTMWDALGVDGRIGAALYAAAWVTILWYLGLYRLRVRWSSSAEIGDLAVAAFGLAVATMAFLYLVKLQGVSRLFLVSLFLVQPVLAFAERVFFRSVFGRLRARGYNRRYMLVVGAGEFAQAFADRVEAHRHLGLEVIGHLRTLAEETMAVSRPILGTTEELGRVFHERVIDEVAICLPMGSDGLADPIVRIATDEGKIVRVPFQPAMVPLPDARMEEFEDLLVRSYANGPQRVVGLAVKRFVDIGGAAIGLVLLSPVLLVVAAAILVREGRPILFSQTRVGLHGRPFRIYKFRTMVPDAETRYSEVAELSDTKGAAFKLNEDPRVTNLGGALRKTSLDELPQLWNVLRGDMSLVGPRPAPPREVEAYDMWHRRRLSVKPGITGLWQVEARFDRHFDDRANLDLRYIDQWSLWLDIKILVRTVPAVFVRTGR
ncbi:MAG: sugar transferase [Chloroflexi bacterium]|nr:sugar transferase [Chloroflexota bacterium]